MGRVVTLGQACRRMGLDTDDFVAELNRRREEETSPRADLPLVPLETLTSTLIRTPRQFGPHGEWSRAVRPNHEESANE